MGSSCKIPTGGMRAFRCHPVLQNAFSITRSPPAVQRAFSSARDRTSSASDEELQAARSWLAKLRAEAIPLKNIGELSFSRSSGPGGQNVNKYDKLTTC